MNAVKIYSMPFKCCQYIQNNTLVFYHEPNSNEFSPSLRFCCETYGEGPHIPFDGSAEECLDNFMEFTAKVKEECRTVRFDNERVLTKDCVNCRLFAKGRWKSDDKIHRVNFSVYPSPCQSKCVYCTLKHMGESYGREKADALYAKIFDVVSLAKERSLIADDALWVVSAGEIAIHPYRDKFADAISGGKSVFLSNCMKFYGRIAKNLAANPHSTINISLDCGTAETWKKVKGADNFDTALESLKKYDEAASAVDQLTFKYIILPGLNDSPEDFSSFIRIIKGFRASYIRIARNSYNLSGDDEYNELIGAAAFLTTLARLNKVIPLYVHYTPKEVEIIRTRSTSVELSESLYAEDSELYTALLGVAVGGVAYAAKSKRLSELLGNSLPYLSQRAATMIISDQLLFYLLRDGNASTLIGLINGDIRKSQIALQPYEVHALLQMMDRLCEEDGVAGGKIFWQTYIAAANFIDDEVAAKKGSHEMRCAEIVNKPAQIKRVLNKTAGEYKERLKAKIMPHMYNIKVKLEKHPKLYNMAIKFFSK